MLIKNLILLSILEPITIYRTNCIGARCGDECVDDSRGGFKGICDGQGACVSPIENPCSVHGCGGKQCGERCLEGDIAGFCDSQGTCNFDMRADLCIDSAFNTGLFIFLTSGYIPCPIKYSHFELSLDSNLILCFEF